jgi:hypothetical protein
MFQSARKRHSMRKALVFLICLLLCGASVGFTEEKKIKYTGTFSNLTYHREAGDLLGVEIKIVATRKGYQGALQIAEGGPSPLMVVDVFFEKDRVRFEIPKSYPQYGGGVFEGQIDSRGIRGAFKFGEVKGNQENLVRGRSYWDK